MAETFAKTLTQRLSGATRIAVLGIGDDLNPRDRPGILGSLMIHELQRPNVTVFLPGVMPENYTGALRKLRPSHILMLDAADLGRPPGSLAIIHPDEIRGQRYSTHAMPLSMVIEYLEQELESTVVLVGIQPDETVPLEDRGEGPVGADQPLSPEVSRGLTALKAAFSDATRDLW